MPTSRPRHQTTETPAVADALDVAMHRWPDETRPQLLLRLVHAGGAALEREQTEAIRHQRDAIEASSGKYEDAFGDDYLAELRREWPDDEPLRLANLRATSGLKLPACCSLS